MTEAAELLKKQEEEIMRIRQKRKRNIKTDGFKKFLNVAFMILAAIGCILYFALPESHLYGLVVLGIGMFLKIIEIFMRVMM